MTSNKTVDELWEAAFGRFPTPSPEEQRAGIVLLGELARGAPVTIAHLARALGTPIDTAEALVKHSVLSPFVDIGDAGRIQGFGGLSVAHTHHQLTVNGRTLWTWCALDSLFIPELLGDTAEIESRDPETGELIRLAVSPARVETAEPTGILVSMMPPGAVDLTSLARVMASCCHFIFFFASRASAEGWQAKHPETVLRSLNEAFSFAKRQNAHVFGAELARRRANAE